METQPEQPKEETQEETVEEPVEEQVEEAAVENDGTDTVPMTLDEFKEGTVKAATHFRDNFIIPVRRTIRGMFGAITAGAETAADELSGKKKRDK